MGFESGADHLDKTRFSATLENLLPGTPSQIRPSTQPRPAQGLLNMSPWTASNTQPDAAGPGARAPARPVTVVGVAGVQAA